MQIESRELSVIFDRLNSRAVMLCLFTNFASSSKAVTCSTSLSIGSVDLADCP